MSKQKKTLLALIAIARSIQDNNTTHLLPFCQIKKKVEEFRQLWLGTDQKTRDAFIERYPTLWDVVSPLIFEIDHPAWHLILRYHEEARK